MKECTTCKVDQPFTSFHKSKRDGLKSQCKTCVAEYGAKYQRINREARAAYDAEYLANPANNLRTRATTAFHKGLIKAAEFNEGVTPIISAEERELMVSFLMAARTLSETTGIAFEVDHIIPLSKGGAHSLANLQCITEADNRAKKDSLDFTNYSQQPSFPRPEDIAACEVAA